MVSQLWVVSKVVNSGLAGTWEEIEAQVLIGGMGSLGRSWRVYVRRLMVAVWEVCVRIGR